MNKLLVRVFLAGAGIFVLCSSAAHAQEANVASAVAAVKVDIQNESRALNTLRDRIASQRSELTRTIRALEGEVAQLRDKAQGFRHAQWYRDAGFDQLQEEVAFLTQELEYAAALISDYRRSAPQRMHDAELQRFETELASIDAILDRPEPSAALQAFAPLLSLAQTRDQNAIGGYVFGGKAADSSGVLHQGRFIVAGPVGYFVAEGNALSGLSQAVLGSPYPSIVYPVDADALSELAAGQSVEVPVDLTLGEAIKMEQEKDSWWEHLQSGGAIMIPILLLGLVSVSIAVRKLLFLSQIRRDVDAALPGIFDHLQSGDTDSALRSAQSLGAPWAPVLEEGVKHHHIEVEHLEELLHEKTLAQIPYLEKHLAVLAVTAAASPLLGLLGTVTGMIHTFDLVAVFGTGKANLLSGGISEALVTTEFGLVVAIPALLMHAYLSGRVQKFLHQLEQMNTAFVNGLKIRRIGAKEARV